MEVAQLLELYRQGQRNFFNIDLSNAQLRSVVLIGIDLRGSTLNKADLSSANLIEANLTGANLIETNLRGALLRGANFSDADLSWANLTWSNSSNSKFIRANLSVTNFSGANLIEADFTGAIMKGSNLRGTNLRGTIFKNLRTCADTEFTGVRNLDDRTRLYLCMIAIVSIALFFELIFTGLWWLISIMIGIHFLNEGIFFMIAAFFYGFSFYDYSLERHREGIGGSMNYALSNKLNLLLSGTIFLVLYNIPLIGVIIAPVLTTILSIIVYLKNKSQSTTNS